VPADLSAGEEVPEGENALIEGPVLHREATSKSFKKKDAILTPSNMIIISSSGKTETRETVPISSLVGVERIDASAVSQKHALQLVCAGRPSMCIALASTFESQIWLQAFRKALRLSPFEQMPVFHAGTSKDGKWTCCKGRSDDAPPCSKSHRSACIDQFSDNPAPEVWAHKLFAMLLACRPRLEAKYRNEFLPEPDRRRREHVSAMLSIVDDINLSHLLHQDSPVAHPSDD